MTDLAAIDTTAVEVYRPAAVMTPADLASLVHTVEQAKREALRDGIDYGKIPGTGDRPTLLKPGAERLLMLFGLGHRIDIIEEERDRDGIRVGVTVKATITRGDLEVGSSLGAADYTEKKFQHRNGERAPWNTVLKMAQKRALVGACLHVTGSSGMFTADMDDEPDPAELARGYARTAAKKLIGDMSQEVKDRLNIECPPETRKEWGLEDWLACLVLAGRYQTETGPARTASERVMDDVNQQIRDAAGSEDGRPFDEPES